MRRFGWTLLALLLVGGAALAAAVILGPSYAIRVAEARLEAETGYRWHIAAEPSLVMRPGPGLVIRRAHILMEGDGGPIATFDADAIDFGSAALDLLAGDRPDLIELDGVTIRMPPDWHRLSTSARPSPPADATNRAFAERYLPRRVILKGATVQLTDERDRVEAMFGGLDADAVLRAADDLTARFRLAPAEIDGAFELGGARTEGGGLPLRLTLASPHLPDGLTARGVALADGPILTVSQIDGELSANHFSGAMVADLGGKPNLRLDVAFPKLAVPRSTGAPAAPSLAPGDLGFFRMLDGRLNLYAGKLVAGPVSVENVRLDLRSVDAVVTAGIPEVELYGGRASLAVGLDASGDVLRHTLRADIHDVQGSPLLTDLAGFTLLDGRASATVDLAGSGSASSDIARSLMGRAELDIRDGHLNAVDLPAIGQAISAFLPSIADRKDAGTTAFDRLAAHFAVAGGRAATEDLAISGPLASATGVGTIDLAAQTIDMRLQSQLAGLSGIATGMALRVPISVSGPLAAPTVRPDIGAASPPAAPADSAGDPGPPPGSSGGVADTLGTWLGSGGLGALLDAIGPASRDSSGRPGAGAQP